jgi:hypothetical protein
MWPAGQNLLVLLEQSCYLSKFIWAVHQLEGGIMTVALALFAGTIHLTITLKGGMLVGINWVSAKHHYAAVRCFER